MPRADLTQDVARAEEDQSPTRESLRGAERD